MSIEVLIIKFGSALVVRFTNPEGRNPLSSAVLDHLHEIIDNLERTSDVNTVVFTGSENVFASGANLHEIAALDAETAPAFAVRGQSLMNKIAGLHQTTVAAINGFCYGGALDLALACDLRIASPDASFAHPGAGLGIITGWGGTQRLPRLIGQANTLEMFFTAEPINARRAFVMGLVDAVTDDIFNNELLSLDLKALRSI